MAVVLKKEKNKVPTDWLLVLAYIGAKRTQEPAFRQLFDQILADESHVCHSQASVLANLYDFTPLGTGNKDSTS